MKVLDEQGREYDLGEEIGKGGQGSVHLTTERKYVIKMISPAADPVTAKRIRSQLAFIRRQDLGKLPLARPLCMLAEPTLGYVMELAEDMCPLSDLKGITDLAEYIKTGGIKRRVALLRKLAFTLSTLHEKGLIYADLSPTNVFVSEDPEFDELFLIDTDNITAITTAREGIYTPFYGAPELVKGTGTTDTYSDAWAFAVVAFEVLCSCHPLIGEYVNDGEPELEDQALRGDLPWIEDEKDDLNFCDHGIPRELVLNKRLMGLFRRTFEGGKLDPLQRPSLVEWEAALFELSQYLIKCTPCGSTYFYKKSLTCCPFCDSEIPELYRLMICRWEPKFKTGTKVHSASLVYEKGRPKIVGNYVFGKQQACILPKRAAMITANLAMDQQCQLKIINNKTFKLTPLGGNVSYVSSANETGKEKEINTALEIPLFSKNRQYFIHFKPLSASQRVFFVLKM